MIGRNLWTIGQVAESLDDSDQESTGLNIKVFRIACYYLASDLLPLRIIAALTLKQTGSKLIRIKADTKVHLQSQRLSMWTLTQCLLN